MTGDLSRRRFLAATGVAAGLSLAAGACSNGDDPGESGSGGQPPPPPPTRRPPATGDLAVADLAARLEKLAVDTYSTVLTTNPVGLGDLPGAAGQVVRTLATTTMAQHEEHKRAFQTQTRLLGGPEQTEPNPKFQLIVDFQLARVRTPADVLDFAALLEKVATDTYLVNLTMLEDPRTKEIMAGVMGVEAQHAASLRTLSSLLEADAPQLVKIPVGADLGNLPRSVGSLAFPDALHAVGGADLIAQPETGAVR